MSFSQLITDHDQIRSWAAVRQASPAELPPHYHDGEPSELRFMFLDCTDNDPRLKPVSWEYFFRKFDLLGLAFVYEDEDSGRPGKSYQLLQIDTGSAWNPVPTMG